MRPVGIKEVAEMAGVSVGTVDRVIHNRGRVSPATRDKVLKVCRELNYHPNVLAQRLAADDPVLFAVLVPEFTSDNAYWQIPLEGIRKAEEELASYRVETECFFFSRSDPDSFRQAALDCLLLEPEGILMAPAFEREAREFVQKCQQKGIPYVFIDSALEKTDPLSSVFQDPFNSGYIAGRLLSFHLRKKSHVLIVNFSADVENNKHLKNREEGLRKFFIDNRFTGRVETLNIAPQDELLLTTKLEEAIHPKTRGLFVTSSAHKVARSLKKIGKSRLMVVGYDLTPDNIRYLKMEILDVLLCQKPATQGFRGLMSLFDHVVRKKEVPKEQTMPVDIIVRENYSDYNDLIPSKK